ncbi:hypothetical protein WJX82_008172 [Trebouxia sp. C0006]
MPVDAVFCDQSGKEFNEFIPVDLVLGPYVRDLQAAADAHCSKAEGLQVSSNRSSLGDERASSGQSVTESISAPQGPSKLPRWKTRTAEQYVAHRRNQHKYREREKQRLHELSSTLQDLSLRMQEQAIQDAETELLEKEAEQLQQLSRELDAELAAFQKRISFSSDCVSSRPGSPPSSLPTQSSGETSQGSLQSSTIPCSLADTSQQHHTMYEAYEYLVNEIKDFMHSLGYWPIPMTGDIPDVSAETASHIHRLMKDLMTVCMEMCRLSNSMRQDVRSYLTATAEELDKPELCSKPNTFSAIVDKLQLSQAQRAEMLRLRKLWRDYLVGVYDERQQLNQQILAQFTSNAAAMESTDRLWQKQEYITPHSRANIVHADKHQQPPSQPVGHATPIKQEEQAAVATDVSPQQDLSALIAKLEQNLEKELRHISEQDYITVAKTLKPVQASWFIILAYPEHCDCLALLNAIQRQDDQAAHHDHK